MGKIHKTTMQPTQFIGLCLGHACKAFMQCRCYQNRHLQPQTLPTACTLSALSGFTAHSEVPAAPSRASIMGPVWASNFHLDTAHMRFQHPSKTLSMLRCPIVRSEGPIVLIMLAKNCRKPSVAWEEASKTHPPKYMVPRFPMGGWADQAAPPKA